jgi:hypothetical protein
MWQPYEFSMRWGVEGDPGHQGYHGLKAMVPDEFITLGKVLETSTSLTRVAEPEGSRYLLYSTVLSDRQCQARILTGEYQPASIWLNGQRFDQLPKSVTLQAGNNPLLLRYDSVGRGYVVFFTGSMEDLPVKDTTGQVLQVRPLAMRWYGVPGVLPYDPRPGDKQPAGWYRFTTPPGLRGMNVNAYGRLTAWGDGRPMKVVPLGEQDQGLMEYRLTPAVLTAGPVQVAIRIEQNRGCYGGSALPKPIYFDCSPGLIEPGDWSRITGLTCYSGGAWYRKNVKIDPVQAGSRAILDLGEVVSSAEVHVNGRKISVLVAPPWQVDISQHLRCGDNRIEVLVYNTLANHYRTIPTRYRGSLTSGMLGPISIKFHQPVSLFLNP